MQLKKYCVWKNNELWEIVRDNPDKPWSWYYLSANTNITWEIVRDNPDKDWNWFCLSQNPNITWEIVRDNPDKPWDYTQISRNLFLYDPTVNNKYQSKDINFRYNIFKNIFDAVSAFSRNIDKIIKKRLNCL